MFVQCHPCFQIAVIDVLEHACLHLLMCMQPYFDITVTYLALAHHFPNCRIAVSFGFLRLQMFCVACFLATMQDGNLLAVYAN